MKNSRKVKRELDNLKREIRSLSYYVDQIKPLPGASAKSHQNARAVLSTIDYLLRTKFKELDQEITEDIKASSHELFMEKLGKTNSPTNNMMRQSNDNVELSRNLKQFVKNSVQRKIDGIPQQNIRESSPQSTRGRPNIPPRRV